MRILIVPGNIQSAKSYPHWDKLVDLLKGHEIKKIEGILREQEILDLVNWCSVWISIDSFLPHLVKCHRLKPGIVLWGKSDPLIFGYPENRNLLKDRKHLREQQFKWWKDEPADPSVFVDPQEVVDVVNKLPYSSMRGRIR
jgi:hypothetical protein